MIRCIQQTLWPVNRRSNRRYTRRLNGIPDMAFYRDLTVPDSYDRVETSLSRVSVQKRLQNLSGYKGAPWYAMPNVKATEPDHSAFPSFYSRTLQTRPKGNVNVPSQRVDHDLHDSPTIINPVRHGILSPIEGTNSTDLMPEIDGKKSEANEFQAASVLKPRKSRLSRVLLSSAARAPLIALDRKGHEMLPPGTLLDSSLRESFSALQSNNFDAFRIAVHKQWSQIKERFLSGELRGLTVKKEFLEVLVRHTGGYSLDFITSILKHLPPKFQDLNSRIRYYEFVEYFGVLNDNGLAQEPITADTVNSESLNVSDTDTQDVRVVQKNPFPAVVEIENVSIPVCEHDDACIHDKAGADMIEEVVTEISDNQTLEEAILVPLGEAEIQDERKDNVHETECFPDIVVDSQETNTTGLENDHVGRHGARIARGWQKYEHVETAEKVVPSMTMGERSDSMDVAISLTRQYSAVLVQAAARGFIVRQRNKVRKALAHFMRREDGVKRIVLHAVGRYCSRLVNVREYCTRQLHKWNRYCRRLKRHKRTFRVCYWLFYTWRKTTECNVYRRMKAQNIIHIFNSFWVLRHFKAWKRLHSKKRAKKAEIMVKIKLMERYRVEHSITIWHAFAKHRAIVLKNWRQKGRAFARANYISRNLFWFATWRYRTQLSVLSSERVSMWWCSPIGLKKQSLHAKSAQLPKLPSVLSLMTDPVPPPRVKLRLEEFCDAVRIIQEAFEVRERAVNFCIVSRVGRLFIAALQEDVQQSRKMRFAYAHYTSTLSAKMFSAFFRATAKAISIKRVKETNKSAARWPPGDDSHESSPMFTSDEINNPTGWDKSNNPTRNSPANETIIKLDELGDTAASIAQEMLSTNAKEEQDRAKQILEDRKRREKNLLEAEKRREIRIQEAKEQWDRDIINRRKALQDGEHIYRRFEDEKTRAHERRIIRSIEYRLEEEAEEEQIKVYMQQKREEQATTLQHRSDILGHMSDLRNKRAKMLVNACYKVLTEREKESVKNLAVLCLRRLRIFVTQKNSMKLMKRSRLKNWLRICSRLRYLDRGMPVYFNMRLRWACFNSWVTNVQLRQRFGSVRLGLKISRRKKLLSLFSQCIDGKFSIPQSLLSSHPRALYCRWIEYVQTKVAYRSIVTLFRAKKRLKILQACFTVLDVLLKQKYTVEARKRGERFHFIRNDLDLQTWRNRLLASYRKLSSRWTRKKHAFITYKMKLNTRNQDSFKKFEARWEQNVRSRIKLEKRMLFLEFQNRGVITYTVEDLYLPGVTNENLDEGSIFSDFKALQTGTFVAKHVDVYVTDWVVGISITVQQNRGPDIELPIHGSMDGTKKTFVLDINKNERLVGVTMDTGDIVGRIRFITSNGRKSPWYGTFTNGNVHSIIGDPTRSIENGEIIGFCGLHTISGFPKLGVVIRYPNDSCIFSNCWKHSGSNQATEEAQFATLLRMRSCDLLESFDRARIFTRKVRATLNKTFVPACFQSNCNALGLWYFEALSRGLIGLYENVQEGESQLARGQILMRSGKDMIARAQEQLYKIPEYRSDGPHLIKPYYTQGEDTSMNILRHIATLEESLEEGQRVVFEGQKLSDEARKLLPKLPVTKSLKLYFEKLYNLALVSESLGPEAFKKRVGGGLREERLKDQQHELDLEDQGTEKTADAMKHLKMSGALAQAMDAGNCLKESHMIDSWKKK